MSHIIAIGNEKGGSGKTTTTMHLIVSLQKLGFRVGSIDLDSRQQSLTRYINNRANYKQKHNVELEVPQHKLLERSAQRNLEVADKEEQEAFERAINELNENDFIIIDTPGSDAFLGRLAHSYADTVITPMNDSFVDLDLLGNVDADSFDSIKPGIYSAMLWEQKMKRALRTKQEQNWFVVRNRLSTLDAKNKRNVEIALEKLSKRFGFKIAPGCGDSVIFKELFLHGLTLHDAVNSEEIRLSPSVIAARQELRNFVSALNIKELNEIMQQSKNKTAA